MTSLQMNSTHQLLRNIAAKMETDWRRDDVTGSSRFELNGSEVFELMTQERCDGITSEAKLDWRSSFQLILMHYTTVAPSSRGLEMDQSQSTTLSGEEYGRETQWSVTIPWTDQVDIQFVYSLAPQELLARFGLKYANEEQL